MKNFFIFIFTFFPLILLAQPRENGKGPIKIEKVSQIISKPTAWCYDKWTSHKWCGWKSVIWAEYRNNDKTPKDASVAQMGDSQEDDQYYNDGGPRNIISLQVKQTKIDTVKFYILYLQSWYFYFDYPYLRKGIHYKRATHMYLLSEQEYQKLWNLEIGINTITFINHEVFDGNFAAGERNVLIAYNNNPPQKSTKTSPFVWYIKKEDEKTIRFQSPTRYSLKGQETKWYTDLQCDFESSYFEVSFDIFNKLKIQ